jgi:hypothetical protein
MPLRIFALLCIFAASNLEIQQVQERGKVELCTIKRQHENEGEMSSRG